MRPEPTDGQTPGDFISLWQFFSEVFVPQLGLELPLKWQHKVACDVLQDAVLNQLFLPNGERAKIIIVNLPPRVGKTKLMEALCCWMMAYFPESQIIYTSYAADLAEISLLNISKVLRSPWFIDLYGDHVHTKRSDYLATMEGGQLFAEGTGGSLTGKGGGLKREAGGFIVIDDPAKPDESLSAKEAENVRKWFENTLKDRRNSSDYCPIIVCAQRLAPLDLPGYLLAEYRDQIHLVKFPALVNGESQFPETISTAELLLYQRTRIGRFVLASKYQQEPVSLGGNLIVTDEFRWYDLTPALQWGRKIITCDTAFTKKAENDFCVLQCWGQLEDSNFAYLIDQARGHWESPTLLRTAGEFWKKHNSGHECPVSKFLIEEATAGPGLIQQFAELGIPTEGIRRVKDKAARVQDVLPYISSGLVYLPKEEPFIDEFIGECAAFTQTESHAHDDQVDCMVDGIQELMAGGGGLLSLYGNG